MVQPPEWVATRLKDNAPTDIAIDAHGGLTSEEDAALTAASGIPALYEVKRLNQFHLTDVSKQTDPRCRPILFYTRSLLYLVSASFEHGVTTPILDMEKYFDEHIASLGLKSVKAWSVPLSASQSTTHGGFDDDTATRQNVISLIETGLFKVDRRTAHGVNIANRIGRGDTAKVIGIIDNRREEIIGNDNRLGVVDFKHRRIVVGLDAHQ